MQRQTADVLRTAREATCQKLDEVFAALHSREQHVLVEAMQILRRKFSDLSIGVEANGNGEPDRSRKNRAERN